MKLNKAGNPNNVTKNTVIKLIGMVKPNGCDIKLYPYSKKQVNIIFFKTLKIFFTILYTSINFMTKKTLYSEIFILLSKANSRVNESKYSISAPIGTP